MALDSLTDLDAAILDVEHQWWPTAGQKESAIRDVLGMTPTRYYQKLNALITTEAALARDPVTVKRCNRVANSRAAGREISRTR